jgi:hypothetical protein
MPLMLFFGLFIALVGGVGVVAPDVLMGVARYAVTPLGLYLAAAFRIVVGIVLIRFAARTRFPTVLRVLGFFVIAAGIVTAFLGVDRTHAILNWWAGLGPIGMRLLPAIALVVGVIIVVAARPRSPVAPER